MLRAQLCCLFSATQICSSRAFDDNLLRSYTVFYSCDCFLDCFEDRDNWPVIFVTRFDKRNLILSSPWASFLIHVVIISLYSPGARDQLRPSRLLRKLANFNFTRIIPWTLVVNAGVAVKTLEWAVCSGGFESHPICAKAFATLMCGPGLTLHH